MKKSEVIEQIESIKENSEEFAKQEDSDEIWKKDIEACDAVIKILERLTEEEFQALTK